jgi:hypothetical protein
VRGSSGGVLGVGIGLGVGDQWLALWERDTEINASEHGILRSPLTLRRAALGSCSFDSVVEKKSTLKQK